MSTLKTNYNIVVDDERNIAKQLEELMNKKIKKKLKSYYYLKKGKNNTTII